MRVSVASDAVFAIARIAADPPDVIVLDVEMPRMDGLQFLSHMAAHGPWIPVVVCSAHAGARSERAIAALALGAVEIVSKPAFGVRGFLEESAITIADASRSPSRPGTATKKSRQVTSRVRASKKVANPPPPSPV